MKEVKHRTDLLSPEAVCFKHGIDDWVFQKMRSNGFPKPEHFRMVPRIGGAPRKILLWSPSVVAAYMTGRVTTRRSKP